jgi:cytochrome c-type biogenesis protein CcmH
VAVHDSEAAEQIKAEVETLVAAGNSQGEILEVFVKRYGEEILAAPRARGLNLLAYLAPALAVIVAGVGVAVLARRWRRPGAPAALSLDSGVDPLEKAWEERLTKELSGFDD